MDKTDEMDGEKIVIARTKDTYDIENEHWCDIESYMRYEGADPHWSAITKTDFEKAFMSFRRAVYGRKMPTNKGQ